MAHSVALTVTVQARTRNHALVTSLSAALRLVEPLLSSATVERISKRITNLHRIEMRVGGGSWMTVQGMSTQSEVREIEPQDGFRRYELTGRKVLTLTCGEDRHRSEEDSGTN